MSLIKKILLENAIFHDTIDEHGLPLINGKNIVNFRFHTPEQETDNTDES